MKGGGYYGLRGKQISLTLIALIGTTIFIWAWEKSPLLTTFLPPQNRILIPSPVDEKQDIFLRKDVSFAVPEGETTEQAGSSLNKDISYAVPEGEVRTDIVEKSSSVVTPSGFHERIDEDNKSSSATEKEDGEEITEQAEKRSDVVTPSGFDTKSIPQKNIDDENEIASSIEKKDGEPRSEQAEKSFDVGSPSGSAIKSTTETNIDDGDKKASSIEKEEGERAEQATKSSTVVTPIDSATGSTPKLSKNVVNKTTSSIEKKDIEMVVPQIKANPKQDGSEETSQDLADKKSEAVTPVVSAIPTTSVEETYSPQNEKKPKKDPEEEKGPDLAEKSSDVVAPVSSANQTTSEEGKDDNSAALLVKKKEACNYAKGEWVEDSTRPLYSGSGCKKWLSEMWACRLTQRTDFSYERFRWKPFNCEMPDFEASSFLRRMQDKTIAIVGDSLGRQQFQSLMCMVTGGEERSDVINVGWEYGLVKARGAIRPDGWAYRFPSTNTTILYYWSASLCDLEPINPTDRATDWAMHLDRPPAFLRRYLHRFDVLVLNTGHHWNRGKLNANRWVMHVGGVPNTDRKLAEIGRAKNFTIYSIANWVNLQLPKHPQLKAFFRTISPRHFFHGDWNTGGSCDNTTPLAGGKEVTQDQSMDTSVSRAVMGTGVKLLDITALSQLRDEGHISRYSIRATPGMQDCLHWCLPGIPDTWNELFIAQL